MNEQTTRRKWTKAELRALAGRAEAGDEQAKAALYGEFRGSLTAYLRRRYGSGALFKGPVSASDLVQRLFASMGRGKRSGGSISRSVWGVLKCRARQKAIAYFRACKRLKRRRSREEYGTDVIACLKSPDTSPTSAVARRESLARVSEIVATWSAADQEIMNGRLAGQSYEDIASASGRSLDAVKRQYSRLVARLRADLRAP